jgi:hypothetical protein
MEKAKIRQIWNEKRSRIVISTVIVANCLIIKNAFHFSSALLSILYPSVSTELPFS